MTAATAAATTNQRDAQDVHATGPAPGPQHPGRCDYVQRDRIRPGGRRVPQPDQARPVGHHRVPIDRVRSVRRPLHGHAAIPAGIQLRDGSVTRVKCSNRKNYCRTTP